MKKQLPTFMSSMAALSMLAAPVVARELPQAKALPQAMRQEMMMPMQKQQAELIKMNGVSLRGDVKKMTQNLQGIGTKALSGAHYYNMGMFNFSYTDDMSFFNDPQGNEVVNVLGAAYAPLTWANVSNEAFNAFSWIYTNPENTEETLVLADQNLTVTYPFALVDMPTLDATGSGGSMSYIFNQGATALYCGGYPFYYTQEGEVPVKACNYEISKGISSSSTEDGATIFGSNNTAFWGNGVQMDAICNLFDKPASPYVLSSVSIVLANTDVDADAEFTMNIRKINEDGSLGDIVGTSIIYGEDIVTVKGSFQRANFPVYIIDEETGLEEEGYVVIDHPILVEVYGATSDKVRHFDPISQGDNHDMGVGTIYGYFQIADETGGVVNKYISMDDLLQFSDGSKVLSSMLFDLDVMVPFLHAPQSTFSVPTAGGQVPVVINSYWISDNIYLAEELPSWVEVTGLVQDPDSGELIYTFAFEALPAGESGREALVTLESIGCSTTLVFTQGVVSGIENVTTSAFKASFVMDQLHVFCPEGVEHVAVFSTSGQLVKQFTLDGTGSAVLDAALAKGTYVVRFAGQQGATLKVVK